MVDCIWILMDYITNFPDNQIIRTIIRRRNFELSPVLARHFMFKFLNIKLTSFRRLQWKIHQNLPPPDPFQRFVSVFFWAKLCNCFHQILTMSIKWNNSDASLSDAMQWLCTNYLSNVKIWNNSWHLCTADDISIATTAFVCVFLTRFLFAP